MKNLNIYEIIIWIYLLLNIFFYPINKDELNYLVSKEVSIYSYWLSVGLIIGFKLCRYELMKILKKRYQRENEIKKNLPLN